MKLYADDPARRTGQILADLVAILAIAGFVGLGVLVHGVIAALGELGVRLQDAGTGFSGTMTEIGDTLGGIPLIGQGIAAPFEGASGAGDSLAEAVQAVQGTVTAVAIMAGILVAAGPVVAILLLWLVPRLVAAARAGELQALVRSGAPLDLVALRALTRRPIRELEALHDDPAGAWRRGDREVIDRLAALELRRAGVALRRP